MNEFYTTDYSIVKCTNRKACEWTLDKISYNTLGKVDLETMHEWSTHDPKDMIDAVIYAMQDIHMTDELAKAAEEAACRERVLEKKIAIRTFRDLIKED